MDLNFFNPRGQDEEGFVAGFVARQKELDFFLKQLQLLPMGQTAQHQLIVAPRGYGKTSLLRRIGIALMRQPPWCERYIPLSFREEQHNVISLDVFWRNCLESLQETLANEGADASTLDALSDLYDRYAPRKQLSREQQDGEPAAREFMAYCERLGRRPVLLIDNLNALLEGLGAQHQWHWRSRLQAADGPVLIAAATQYPSSMREHGAPFYDFFQVHTLQALDDAQVMQCLRHYAHLRGEAGQVVLRQIDTQPGKIIALNAMAGGNPRTLKVLYSVLESQFSAGIVEQLRDMLDKFTGWYQARTEELPMQTRAVFDAVALHWDPITAAELSEITGLDVTVVNSQLSRLEKLGYVEPVKLQRNGKGRSGYQLIERFFNIWYLMRHGSMRMGRRVRFLTAFIQNMFNVDERKALGERMLSHTASDTSALLAVAHSVRGSLRTRLLQHAQNNASTSLHENAELNAEIKKLRPGRKKKTATSGNAQDHARPEATAQFNQALQLHMQGQYDEAEAAYRQAIALDEKYAEPWNGLGCLLQDHLGRYEEAKQAYENALAIDATHAMAHANLAYLWALKWGDAAQANPHIERAMALPGVDPGGLGLLQTLRDIPQGPQAVWASWHAAIASEDPLLYVYYLDDVQRWLAWWVGAGHGPWLLAQMQAQRYPEQYAPLYQAVLALVEGEDQLLRVNPETRRFAQRIYDGARQRLSAVQRGQQ